VDFTGFDLTAPAADDQLLAVHEALDKLALKTSQASRVGQAAILRRHDNEEVSQVLGISLSQQEYWTFSRVWLLNEIEGK